LAHWGVVAPKKKKKKMMLLVTETAYRKSDHIRNQTVGEEIITFDIVSERVYF